MVHMLGMGDNLKMNKWGKEDLEMTRLASAVVLSLCRVMRVLIDNESCALSD